MKNRYLCLLIAACAAAILTSASSFGQAVAQATEEISAANSRNQETALGNLVVDAVKAATNADGAFLPASSLTGTNLASGQVDTESLKAVLTDPTDQIVVLNLTGAQLKSALERSA
ncbi:MAG TPA: 5'-nucleotidase C-terminal domain-containing protein, partial [Armatimonadota bacterium]|nr:5'-nucleotidase C-terminal domain-containing protein [Armatimonadota bacterium]